MERKTSPERVESASEGFERSKRLIGALGLYDASQDVYDVIEHNDEKWAVEPYDNPCIIRGED